MRPVHLALAAALIILTGLMIMASPRLSPPQPLREAAYVSVQPVARPVMRASDVGKPGEVRSVMGQLRFRQDARTSAPSPDRLDFTFDAPAAILGVLVSVDDRGMEMTEVAVGIGADTYGLEARDWLIHTSDTAGGPSTDEHVWFPNAFAVVPGERISVVAWLFNAFDAPHWVSPEVIVYDRWAPGQPPIPPWRCESRESCPD